MNAYEMNIGEEILEKVSGGIPVGRDGKPISAAEYKRRREGSGIHTTSATFGPEPQYETIDVDGLHMTIGSF